MRRSAALTLTLLVAGSTGLALAPTASAAGAADATCDGSVQISAMGDVDEGVRSLLVTGLQDRGLTVATDGDDDGAVTVALGSADRLVEGGDPTVLGGAVLPDAASLPGSPAELPVGHLTPGDASSVLALVDQYCGTTAPTDDEGQDAASEATTADEAGAASEEAAPREQAAASTALAAPAEAKAAPVAPPASSAAPAAAAAAPKSAAEKAAASTPSSGRTAAGRDRDCSDFATQAEAQAYYVAKGGNNADRLDSDHDGIACESHFGEGDRSDAVYIDSGVPADSARTGGLVAGGALLLGGLGLGARVLRARTDA